VLHRLARVLLHPYRPCIGRLVFPALARRPLTVYLDKALRELDSLTAALCADVREASDEHGLSAPVRLRKEALMTTRILVSKLQVVRALENPPWTVRAQPARLAVGHPSVREVALRHHVAPQKQDVAEVTFNVSLLAGRIACFRRPPPRQKRSLSGLRRKRNLRSASHTFRALIARTPLVR
jgi:hypothetical protein